MKLTGKRATYHGREFPERKGRVVNVIKRIGNSRAYEIVFMSDGKQHDCNKQFLRPKN